MLRKLCLAATAALLAAGFAPAADAASTLETIKQRGKLKCVVAEGSVAIAQLNDKGQWEGFDVDYCRALAAATLGSGDAVEFVPMGFAQSMPAVRSGEAEVAARAITWTMSRDTELGFDFVGPTLYSGYGFMVHKRAGVTDLKGLNGPPSASSPAPSSTSRSPTISGRAASPSPRSSATTSPTRTPSSPPPSRCTRSSPRKSPGRRKSSTAPSPWASRG